MTRWEDIDIRRPIAAPAPGKAVLACRCGAVLDMGGMYRLEPPRPVGSTTVIRPIVCFSCAVEYETAFGAAA